MILLCSGALILFTGFLSVWFLKRRLYPAHYAGMAFVVCGLSLVGVASVLTEASDAGGASNPMLGDALIVMAQLVAAIQMVRASAMGGCRPFSVENVSFAVFGSFFSGVLCTCTL